MKDRMRKNCLLFMEKGAERARAPAPMTLRQGAEPALLAPWPPYNQTKQYPSPPQLIPRQ